MSTVFTVEELSTKYAEMSVRADRLEEKLAFALSVIESLTSAHANQVCAMIEKAPPAVRGPIEEPSADLVASRATLSEMAFATSLALEFAGHGASDSASDDEDMEKLEVVVDKAKGDEAAEIDDGEEDVTCAVCLEVLVGPCTMIACGHVFCAGCIIPWVQDHDEDVDVSCPCCRTQAPSSGNPFVRARSMEEMVRKWVMRRVARGPWAGLEEWRRKDQSWIIELRSNPLLSGLR